MKRTKLSDIASLTVGFVGTMTQHYVDSGIPFLRSLNIKLFYIDNTDLKYISASFSEELSKSILNENDIVIVRTGIPGTCCVVPKEYDGCNCADVVIVHPDFSKVNPYYLAAYINIWGQKQILNNKVGAIQQHFNVHTAEEMLVFLPDKETQDHVANLICSVNEKIQVNERLCAELEAMAKTLYDYWFVQFDFPDENGKPYRTSGGTMEWCQELGREVPKGWKTKRVSDLTKVVTGKEDANFSTADGEYKFFTCGQEPLCCDTPAFTGKAVLIAGNRDFNVKHYKGSFNAYQRTYVLIPNEDKYFAAMFIAAKDTIQAFRQGSNGSIVKFITKGDVENITLLSPTNDDLLQRLNGIIEQIELFEKENDELIKLRDWLLPMLMNGQAYVKVGGDESV